MSSGCGCTEEEYNLGGLMSIWNILQCQRASDFLISLAYFSIPLELCYFVSCSSIFPFSWIFLQFGAFIVLCGLTHFVNGWTYAPHSFHLMLVLTVLKFLTALVSCATSITLVTLLPQMLRVMVREGLLRKKTKELRYEVGMMKRQEEASWHVRMLTREIRRSLDRHTILYTTLIELSKLLFLENCAVWMPDEERRVLNLTHELKRMDGGDRLTIPLDDPDIAEVIERKGVRVLGLDSRLRRVFGSGEVTAVRVPILRVSNFKGGTPEMVEECYGVLVLVLPLGRGRDWALHELEIIEVVADQVAVALSHAAVLEESVRMREKLMEQNMVHQRARQEVLLAREARDAFKKVISQEMAAPSRSITAILSCLEHDDLRPDQQAVVDVMMKSSLLLSTYIEDVADVSNMVDSRLELESRPFSLHSMLRDVINILKLWCTFRGVCFDFDVPKDTPDCVVGDDKRVVQAVLFMVGNVVLYGDPGNVILRLCVLGGPDPKYLAWKRSMGDDFVWLRFEVSRIDSEEDVSSLVMQKDGEYSGWTVAHGLSFTICKKLAELMHGTVTALPTPEGHHRNINMTIRLQLRRSQGGTIQSKYPHHETSGFLFKGMDILLADGDSFNQSITRKLLEKMGCHLFVASSWYECLDTLHQNVGEFHLLLIDLNMLEESIHEMSARVRKLQSGSWRLIIGLTLKANQEIRDRCRQNGIHGVICKPVVLQEMEDELQRIIQHGGQLPGPLLHGSDPQS
ncbi:ethylene receptor 2-like [Magnolia sinica]|uniref:ethylene receptor 2-like n=1 Tax=Magnolia sinica TaxID=86752 RepID=UPI00265A437B|nr:ethylene receptor 2-like [Magnolia sinica]